jgi:tRNA-splicing ligase RtcB
LNKGFGNPYDIEFSEEGGAMQGADPSAVSNKAYKRGKAELGTLGAGNHFIEIGYVQEIFNDECAEIFGLFKNQVVFWIHTGSRGLGHQVCTDYLDVMGKAVKKYGIALPDRQLNAAPVNSPEGKKYFGAMAAAANYAWANRQVLTHYVREAVCQVLETNPEKLNMNLLYDVAHNVGKIESHIVSGKTKNLLVHRKGATRAFGPGNPEIPGKYRDVGQPVLVPGDMGRASYVLAGTQRAMEISFGSACHGAGRALSRSQARKTIKPKTLMDDLSGRGVYIRTASVRGLVEEAPEAYKDVDEVVEAAVQAGLVQKVAKLKPLGVVKG